MTSETAPAPPASLLARLRADPIHAPELVALAAAEKHGPAAEAWVAEKGRREPAKLARRVKRIHARYARLEGAATGVGGWMTMLPDIAAVGWIQSRMVFFLAATYGYDPRDPMRSAELLVLWGLFEDPVQARAALDGVGRSVASAAVDKAVSRDDERALIARLSRVAATRGGRHLAGRMIPGAAIFFNAIGNERGTRELADRAIRFYGGT